MKMKQQAELPLKYTPLTTDSVPAQRTRPPDTTRQDHERRVQGYLDMEDMFNKLGTSMMSDDMAAGLMALFHLDRGANEMFVFGKAYAGLMLAQKKANVYGGQIPNPKIMKQFYMKVEEFKENNVKCAWVAPVVARYGEDLLRNLRKKR